MRDLAVAELVGGLGVEQVVDASGTAAEVGFGDLFDFELGDLREEFARLLPATLRVTKVAGVVIGDAEFDGRARSDGLDGRENLADVLALCGECGGACGPRGVVAE